MKGYDELTQRGVKVDLLFQGPWFSIFLAATLVIFVAGVYYETITLFMTYLLGVLTGALFAGKIIMMQLNEGKSERD